MSPYIYKRLFLIPRNWRKIQCSDKISCILPTVSNLKHNYKTLVTFVSVWLKFSWEMDVRIYSAMLLRAQIFGKLPNIRYLLLRVLIVYIRLVLRPTSQGKIQWSTKNIVVFPQLVKSVKVSDQSKRNLSLCNCLQIFKVNVSSKFYPYISHSMYV